MTLLFHLELYFFLVLVVSYFFFGSHVFLVEVAHQNYHAKHHQHCTRNYTNYELRIRFVDCTRCLR